jgi:hypothetical protein
LLRQSGPISFRTCASTNLVRVTSLLTLTAATARTDHCKTGEPGRHSAYGSLRSDYARWHSVQTQGQKSRSSLLPALRLVRTKIKTGYETPLSFPLPAQLQHSTPEFGLKDQALVWAFRTYGFCLTRAATSPVPPHPGTRSGQESCHLLRRLTVRRLAGSCRRPRDGLRGDRLAASSEIPPEAEL